MARDLSLYIKDCATNQKQNGRFNLEKMNQVWAKTSADWANIFELLKSQKNFIALDLKGVIVFVLIGQFDQCRIELIMIHSE